eukprot:gene22340-44132_t
MRKKKVRSPVVLSSRWNGSAVAAAFHSPAANASRDIAAGVAARPGDRPTCAAVLRLTHVDAALMRWNSTTLRRLWGPKAGNVTVRDLLAMSSGFADYDTDDFRAYQQSRLTYDIPPWEILHRTPKGFACDPGPKCGWAAYDQRAVLPPATGGWPATGFVTHGTLRAHNATLGGRAAAHGYDCSGWDVYGMSAVGGWTCGNLLASPLDVARFVHVLYGTNAILNATTVNAMQQFRLLNDGDWSCYYGMGTMLLPTPINGTGYNIGHGGATYGFYSMTGYNWEHDFTLSVATNHEEVYQSYYAVFGVLKRHGVAARPPRASPLAAATAGRPRAVARPRGAARSR